MAIRRGGTRSHTTASRHTDPRHPHDPLGPAAANSRGRTIIRVIRLPRVPPPAPSVARRMPATTGPAQGGGPSALRFVGLL